MMLPTPRAARLGAVLIALTLVLLILGCNVAQVVGTPNASEMSATMPRWACPSVTPLPYGPGAPPKRVWDTPNADGTTTHHREDFVIWEREYGGLGSPPPAPTPYTKNGDRFFLGQLVNFANSKLDVTTTATKTDVVSGTNRLYTVELALHNMGAGLPFNAARQVTISRITRADGRQLSGVWRMDQATFHELPTAQQTALISGTIKTGDSQYRVPIYAPDGEVQSAELQLDVAGADTTSTGTLRVSYIPGHESDCSHPGTAGAVYPSAPTPVVGVSAPPGTDGIVAFALSQVGRQYCWGGKGWQACSGCSGGCVTPPCASLPCWDCSGLSWGAYQSVGVTIGQGTANQQNYPEVRADQIQPGDLILFGGINAHGRGQGITHVGVYAGDLDGDGTGDLIHAANYPDGVIITKNVFANPYYRSRVAIITRPPRGVSR